MIKSNELCPKCNSVADYSSYFNKHSCTNKECGFNQLIVRKNEDYIEYLHDLRFRQHEVEGKINEIIMVLNKITNPYANDKNVVRGRQT